ncbi:unnamed protein product [Timema podura]|uniref:Uncharacterized protein n=1 Tax=Timema podura TaxID=61482 RepID=A0ABN7NNL1_TIMPD|nr:unnamed protein product [Timema podura]
MWPQQTKGWTYDAASGREGEDVYYGLRKGGRTYDVASGKKGRIHALALGREGEDVCHGLRKGEEDVEKQPEEFDEDDLRVVMEYEEKGQVPDE